MRQETYRQFKRRITKETLLESFDSNKIYGLSREHIELVLGIRLPFLLESIVYKTEEHILREQYLYEQFMQSVRAAAGQAKQAVVGAATTAATAVKGAVAAQLQKVKDAAGIFQALGLIFQNPTLVQEFGSEVSQHVATYINPIAEFMGKAIKWLKAKTEKIWEYIKGVFNKAYEGISGI